MIRLLLSVCALSLVCADFELHVLHTNDVHARFDEMNKYGGACKDSDAHVGNCYGGMARLKTKIDHLREQYPNHTILLDGGDYFQGTIWFHFYKGWSAAHFMNIMGYDAMAVGNHEFDNGPTNTANFARNISFPFLSVNMRFAENENLLKNLVTKSIVKVVDGQKIGIIGYTTPETAVISRVGDSISFDEIIPTVRAEAQRLQSVGVTKIIALGHAGFKTDQQVAKEVTEIDVVVGGHTDTFLYTGTKPSNEEPVDVYPKVVVRSDGSKALVVQDYTFAKYLGHLKVVFDDKGGVKNYSGNPIILDKSIARDPDVQKDLESWKQPLLKFSQLTIGRSFVHLNGSKVACRQRECNMGNLITDALVFENLNHADSEKWADAPIAMMNSGGIRNSLTKGTITIAKIMSVLPFRNTVDIITVNGSAIVRMLEHGLSDYENIAGRFMQVSGLRAWYNMSAPIDHRVVKVLARCYQCISPGYAPLELNKQYRVIAPQYIIEGGDGFGFLGPLILQRHKIGNVDSDMVVQFIHTADEQVHTIAYGRENRLNFLKDESADPWNPHT